MVAGADMLTVEVRDNGIGIAPDQREVAFEVFRRLVSREQYPGNGIGLAVCKRIVLGHGGVIELDGVEGKGTTVRFTLPS